MKVIFKGDPKVFVFEPIPKGKGGRKKTQNRTESILSGDKEAYIDELCDVIKWARNLSNHEWWNITHDANGGLRGVISRVVDGKNVR